jgi:FMN hydrolase / 5-amino-6-(5-phospho-D-ribitylamino)uracil phosphatase
MTSSWSHGDNVRMTTVLRAVSLDLDNTLWDTPPVLKRAEAVLRGWLTERAPSLAVRYDDAALQALRQQVVAECPGQAHDMTFIRTESLRRAARACALPETVASEAFEVFIAARNEITPYPEVREALERLAARVPLYAVTNGNACVRRVGLGMYFRGSIDAAGVGAAKPDPRIYARLLEEVGADAATVLHVGDDAWADVAGARAAGLRTAWINRGEGAWPTELPPADHEIADLRELVRIVEGVERSA